MAYSNPHSPYLSPTLGSAAGERWGRDEKTYASMIEFLDQGVGSVLRTLKENNLERNTIVFFSSDNGPRSEPTEQQTRVVTFFDSNGSSGFVFTPLLMGAKYPGASNASLRRNS
jgi:arylsulfatase A-like enzyme